jgi:hypothetical protein
VADNNTQQHPCTQPHAGERERERGTTTHTLFLFSMASAAPRRSFVDVLHRGTVYFLAASTVYFSVECVRATYYIQVRW